MYSSEVVSKLRFFIDARRSIQEDRHLSPAGKERAGKNLEQSIELFRGQAFQALEQAWKDARRQYNQVEELRRQAEKAEGARWNYDALNYESQAMRSRLSGLRTVQEIAQFAEGVLSSGNMEKARVTAEIVPGVLRERFPGVEGERLSRELTRRLERLLDTPELAQVRALENEGGNQVVQLVRDTQETADFYSEGFWSTGNEFLRLLSNVDISHSYKPEEPNVFQVTTITFTEQAPAGVVA